jgi:hypothetical protein
MTCQNREIKVISESLAKMIILVQLPGQIGVPKSALQVRYVQTPKADTRSSGLHLTINLKKGATSEVHKFEKSFLGKDIMGFH